MKYLKIPAVTLILCLMISCVPIPKRVGTRGSIKQKDLTFLEHEPISREDVLLHLGQPEEIIQGGGIYDYKWIGSWDYASLIIQSGSIEVQHCNILRFYFDGQGTVQDVYIHSYKPKVLLQSNRECYYDQPAGSTMSVLRPRISADYTFIRAEQTGGQEVLQRLGWADVGLKESRLFWFRWDDASPYIKAKSGRVVLPKAVDSVKSRKQKIHNLLVELDKNDIVLRVENIKDQDLISKLVDWSNRSGQALPKLSSLADNHYPATTDGREGHNWLMSVDVDTLKFWDGLRNRWFTVSYDRVRSMKIRKKAGIHPDYTLYFLDKNVWGKEVNVGINPEELLTVLKYMTHDNPLLGIPPNTNSR